MSNKRTLARPLNGIITVLLLLSSIPISAVPASATAAPSAQPAQTTTKNSPPPSLLRSPKSQAETTPAQTQVVEEDIPGDAAASTATSTSTGVQASSVSGSASTCTGPAVASFGKDLEMTIGPAWSNATYKLDQPSAWGSRMLISTSGTPSMTNSCATTPGGEQVNIYKDDNYSGSCAQLSSGYYPDSSDFGLGNDALTSIKVGGNAKITIYQNDDYDGYSYTTDASVANLKNVAMGSSNFNDRTSSLKVYESPHSYADVSAIPLGIDTALAVYKTDSSSGELVAQAWSAADGWHTLTRLGLTADGNPVTVARSTIDWTVFVRSGTKIKYMESYSGVASKVWSDITGINDAAGTPSVVVISPYHLALFYRTTSNAVKFTEWQSGIGWRSTPIALGTPTGTTITNDVGAVVRDENHLAVFGVSASNKLWVKTWSSDNASDWSDTTWTSLIDGVTGKPAVTSSYATHMAVAVMSTGGMLYTKQWTYSGGWTSTTSHSGYAAPINLVSTSSDEMYVLSANASSVAQITQWTSSAWNTTTQSGWTAGQTIAGVVSRPHNLMLLGYDSNKNVQYALYTNQGWVPTVTTTSNASYGVPRGQGIATVNGKSIWVSAYIGTDGPWYLEAKNAATWTGIRVPLNYHATSDTSSGKLSVAVQDLNQDGNDEVVVGTLSSDNTKVTLGVYNVTMSNTAVISITRLAAKIVSYSSALSDLSVATGDLSGDGNKSEVAFAALRTGYTLGYVRAYSFTGSSLVDLADTSVSLASTKVQDVEMTIGQFDSQTGEQVAVASLSGISTLSVASRVTTLRLDTSTSSLTQVYTNTGITTPIYGSDYPSAVASGDTNGDGVDELAFAYGAYVGVYTLSPLTTTLLGPLTSVPFTQGNRSIAVGDVDGDGRAEIFYAAQSVGIANIYKQIKADSSLTVIGMRSGIPGVPLLADLDGDSLIGKYKACYQLSDVNVVAVANSQPVWYENGAAIQSSAGGIANSSAASTENEDGWTVSYGGSVTAGFQHELGLGMFSIGEVRASVTQELMGSTGGATSREESTTTGSGTAYGGNGFSNGVVVYTKTSYKCYQYEVTNPTTALTTTAMSCTVVPAAGTAPQKFKLLEDWYTDDFRAEAGSSWVAVGHHPPNTTTLSVALNWPNNYTVRASPPVDSYRVWWTDPDQAKDISGSTNPLNGASTWSVEKSSSTSKIKSGSFDENTTVSAGVTLFAFSLDASVTAGYGKNWSHKMEWGTGLEFNGSVYNYPITTSLQAGCVVCKPYSVVPYVYQATAKTLAGATYSYLEQDYYLSSYGAASAAAAAKTQSVSAAASTSQTPQAPVVDSATHPDPATWYTTNTVALNWAQPNGDNATVSGYKWNLDDAETMTPTAMLELTSTHTYENVPDGVHYLHIQAVGDNGELSPITNRAIRVDANPPQVMFAPTPVVPNGTNGWYNSPVTISLTATDTVGSGVNRIEYYLGENGWQTYDTPIVISYDTPGVTLLARATDEMGNTSAPITMTIKLDQTPPSSADPDNYGISYANIITDDVGNAQLVLGGVLSDTLSGRMQMEIRAGDNGVWHTVSAVGDLPMPAGNTFTTSMTSLNWIYTPTFEVRGVYPLWGRGVDAAGNVEGEWPLGIFWWEPDAQPSMQESMLSVSPRRSYSGDELKFTVGARNSGYQEAQVAITSSVPAGVTIMPETISDEGQYDTATRVVTWTLSALWPGQTRYLSFRGTADSTTVPITLESQLDMEMSWPWFQSQDVPPEPAHYFYSTTTNFVVQPASDKLINEAMGQSAAPQILDTSVVEGQIVSDQNVTLLVNASLNANYLYIKEWTWNSSLYTWTLAQESGWVPFVASSTFTVTQDTSAKYGKYAWRLSSGDGVKYLGVWVSDSKGQTSNVNEGNLIFTNLMSNSGQSLSAGQQAQYRLRMHKSNLAVLNLVSLSGDADLYVWQPRAGFKPNYYSNGTSTGDVLSLDSTAFYAPEEGVYVVEVIAATDATYRMATAGDIPHTATLAATASSVRLTVSQVATLAAQDAAMENASTSLPQSSHMADDVKARPDHPTSVSSPYELPEITEVESSAPATVYTYYMPLIYNN